MHEFERGKRKAANYNSLLESVSQLKKEYCGGVLTSNYMMF
jgi:hypothetical protein